MWSRRDGHSGSALAYGKGGLLGSIAIESSLGVEETGETFVLDDVDSKLEAFQRWCVRVMESIW